MQTKHCPKCGENKPLSDFSKDKSRAVGVQNQCKLCQSQDKRQYYKTTRDKRLEVSRQYREANRDKLRETGQQWREAHPDRRREALQRYYENNRDKLREANRQWYESNRDKRREYSRQWREANPDKHNAIAAKRRAAKLQRTPQWLTPEHLSQIESFYTAVIAFRLYTGQEYHVDHIVPLQGKNVCGLHVPWNLRVIPAKDNLVKSNKYADN